MVPILEDRMEKTYTLIEDRITINLGKILSPSQQQRLVENLPHTAANFLLNSNPNGNAYHLHRNKRRFGLFGNGRLDKTILQQALASGAAWITHGVHSLSNNDQAILSHPGCPPVLFSTATGCEHDPAYGSTASGEPDLLDLARLAMELGIGGIVCNFPELLILNQHAAEFTSLRKIVYGVWPLWAYASSPLPPYLTTPEEAFRCGADEILVDPIIFSRNSLESDKASLGFHTLVQSVEMGMAARRNYNHPPQASAAHA